MTTSQSTSRSIQPGAVTYRRVAMQMGAWKWGYPRGERRNITKYEAMPDKAGVLRWYAVDTGLAGRGITAHSEPRVKAAYPVAYHFAPGSIHRRVAQIEDVGPSAAPSTSTTPTDDYGQDEADGAACRAMSAALAAARRER